MIQKYINYSSIFYQFKLSNQIDKLVVPTGFNEIFADNLLHLGKLLKPKMAI